MNVTILNERIQKHIEATKNTIMSAELMREQQINFAVGNCFDVFPTKDVITRDHAIRAMNKHMNISSK